MVLQRLREHELYAKRSKCLFNQPELEFLGHVVGCEGVEVDPKKTAVVRDWAVPQNVSEMRSFLGLTNYFRTFVQGYVKLVGPLTNLLRKSISFVWTADCQEAFDGVKLALTAAPMLVMPDYAKPFELIADACGFGIGAALLEFMLWAVMLWAVHAAYHGRLIQVTAMLHGIAYSCCGLDL